MIPSKYNFYTGPAINNTYIYPGTYISDTGEQIETEDMNLYANYPIEIIDNKFMFIDIVSIEEYNAIFFYDENSAFIESIKLSSAKNIIAIPDNAKFWAIRFTLEDKNFNSKKDTNFIYYINNVNPHYKELNKKYAKENNQEFFRASIDDKIVLFDKEFAQIYLSNIEDTFIFLITKYNNVENTWHEYYKGKFNKSDCTFDRDKKMCEIKVSVADNYINILDNYENKYDIIKLAPTIEKIYLHKRPLIQIYVLGSNTITNLLGGIYWESDVDESISEPSILVNTYHFAYIKAGNEFYIKNASVEGVNGVYAGTNGNWINWNGYTCYMGTDKPFTFSNLYIKRNSDNKILYKSEKEYQFIYADNCFLDREDIKMVNVENSTDYFYIESPFLYHIYKRILCDVDSIETSDGIKPTYDLSADDFVSDNKNYKKCIGLADGLFFCTSRTVKAPTKYGINDYGEYFTNTFISSITGLERPLPISRNSWANASLWYVYNSAYAYFEEKLRKKFILNDSWNISSIIKVLLNQIDPTISHEPTQEYSSFLYSDKSPLDLNRFYIYITQKTNILKGEYDQPAQKAELSLEELMSMLRDCFRCYWFIEDNKFKIEHISYFMNNRSYNYNADVQFDFTELKDQFNKKLYQYFQSAIEYNKSDLSSRYEFSWADKATDLFDGVSIDIISNYVQKDKTEDISINSFSSDIDYMLLSPSDFSNDGFALLCPVKNSDGSLELPIIETTLIDENNTSYKAIIQNWYASWTYLIRLYMYDMPAYRIKCNAVNNISVNDIKNSMKHTIKFPSYDDPDLFKLIRTNFGLGKINELSINMNTRQVKADLLYKPK